jgi:hypothetical protein
MFGGVDPIASALMRPAKQQNFKIASNFQQPNLHRLGTAKWAAIAARRAQGWRPVGEVLCVERPDLMLRGAAWPDYAASAKRFARRLRPLGLRLNLLTIVTGGREVHARARIATQPGVARYRRSRQYDPVWPLSGISKLPILLPAG